MICGPINQSIDRPVQQSNQSIEQTMISTLAVEYIDITVIGISFMEAVVRQVVHRTIQHLEIFCSVATRTLLVAYIGLFISPSGISELDCATTKIDTAERSISIGRESLHVFFVLGALAYFQVPPLGGSREEKWRSQ